ncbi:hypothetical protein [Piscibacillus salipiscarius]|uniref:hypothetical protein n=1 Tax=Piscibacillus salipiscarius TaxID=299480 RepID=UPI002436C82E|nr:hypothetical protein [Piscibacillus salipiscarius]
MSFTLLVLDKLGNHEFLIYGVDVHKLLHHDFKGELPTMYEIVAMTQGDVTGDGISDTVYVMGFRESDVSIIRKMSLVINDGATNLLTNIYLEEDMGYDPGLFWVISPVMA